MFQFEYIEMETVILIRLGRVRLNLYYAFPTPPDAAAWKLDFDTGFFHGFG
jgi:hypothetical protein